MKKVRDAAMPRVPHGRVASYCVNGIALLLVGFLASNSVFAAKHPWEDFDKRLAASRSPAALGSDLFGDSVSLQDGTLSFSVTDVSLSGNNALPVAFSRSYRVFNRRDYVNLGRLADWEIDLPRISASTAEEWLSSSSGGNRCSDTTGVQPAPSGFFWRDYFHGLQLEIPGAGGGDLLVRHATTPKPTDGKAYPWMTEGQIHVSCLPSIGNRTGEGFLAVTPDGTKYWFKWMAQDLLPYMEAVRFAPDGGGPLSSFFNPRKTSLYATRVEDAAGNWVQYSYGNAWNQSVQLDSITSSDGRTISVTHVGGRVATVSDGSQTWQYQYGATSSGRDTLTDVILPDNSRWQIDFAPLTNAEIITTRAKEMVVGELYRTCKWNEIPHNDMDTPTGAISHPSGATGRFKMAMLQHGLSNVPLRCDDGEGPENNNENDDQNKFTMKYYTFSLTEKVITGPGLPDPATTPAEALAWTYGYAPTLSWFYPGDATASNPECTLGTVCDAPKVCDGGPCPGSTITTVAGPNGTWERYEFGNSFRYNEGKLLKIKRGSSASEILQTTVNTYDLSLVDQVYPASFGHSQRGNDAFAATHHRPLVKRATTRQGATFTWQIELCGTVYCTDAQAHPEKIRRHSTLGFSRTETTGYWSDPVRWIIGLPTANACIQALPENDACDGDLVQETSYDGIGRPLSRKAFGKPQYTLAYDTASTIASGQRGTLKTHTDGRGNVTALSSWLRGIPQSIVHPDGTSQTIVVNPTGTIASVMNEVGAKTCHGYDAMGRLTSTTHPSEDQPGVCDASTWNPTTQAFTQVQTAEFGIPAGHWRLQVNTGNARRTVYFDALWRPLLTREYDNQDIPGTLRFVRTRHDHAGRNTFTSQPSDNSNAITGTWTTYDALGRATAVSQDSELGLLTTLSSYPQNAFQVTVTNPRLFQTTTSAFQAWDEPAYDLPLTIQQPESATTTIARDAWGKPLALTRGGPNISVTRSYAYNAHQELCRQFEPETEVTLMGYDGAGNLAWSAGGLPPSLGCTVDPLDPQVAVRRSDRAYDVRNRLTALSFADGRGDQAWTYTADGLPASVVTYNGYQHTESVTSAFNYNARRMLNGQGETIHQENSYTWGYGYGYDANGNLASNVYPSGLSVSYAPNALGQLTQVGAYVSGVTYHPSGAVKQFTYGNGVVHGMTPNLRGLPSFAIDNLGGYSVLEDSYAYDENGNVVRITDDASDHLTRADRAMTYDALDRLKTAVSPMWGNQAATYTYNALDNLARVQMPAVSPADPAHPGRDHYYCYDQFNRLTNIKTGGCGGATVGGLGYDLQGNVNNKDGREFDFDQGNRLRRVGTNLSQPSQVLTEKYRYDGLGRRVLTLTPSTGLRVISQYSKNGKLVYQYDTNTNERVDYLFLGSRLVATRTRPIDAATETVEYQHTDGLGSPVAVTDAAGARLRYDKYEPYGLRINRQNDNRPGYTGHVMDAATGLTYMQQRYYDPGIGMFLSVDPVTAYSNPIGQFHRYRYANNNPYKFTDPDGRRSSICLGKNSCQVIQVASRGPIGDLDGAPRSEGQKSSSSTQPSRQASAPSNSRSTQSSSAETSPPSAGSSSNNEKQGSGFFMPEGHDYRVGRVGHDYVSPGSPIGAFVEHYVPAGHTMAVNHDKWVDFLTSRGVSDAWANIPTMGLAYNYSVMQETLNLQVRTFNSVWGAHLTEPFIHQDPPQ